MGRHGFDLKIADVVRAGRFSTLGGTWTFALLGAASCSPSAVDGTLVLVLSASVAFHVSVYGWNDIFDLPIDRTQPRRSSSPLVRGSVSPTFLAAVACGAAAIALTIAACEGIQSALAMGSALAFLLFYNAYGKRSRLPPLLDAIQGLGWAALVFYAAAATGAITESTLWVGAYAVAAIMVINGVHGGIRDLPNDLLHGAKTTAVYFGATSSEEGGTYISRRLLAYAVAAQSAASAVLLGGVAAQNLGQLPLRILLAVVGAGASSIVLGLGLSTAPAGPRTWGFGLLHIVLLLLLPFLLVPGPFDLSFLLLVGVLFSLPTSFILAWVIRLRRVE